MADGVQNHRGIGVAAKNDPRVHDDVEHLHDPQPSRGDHGDELVVVHQRDVDKRPESGIELNLRVKGKCRVNLAGEESRAKGRLGVLVRVDPPFLEGLEIGDARRDVLRVMVHNTGILPLGNDVKQFVVDVKRFLCIYLLVGGIHS